MAEPGQKERELTLVSGNWSALSEFGGGNDEP
jgi:hypothetical protein